MIFRTTLASLALALTLGPLAAPALAEGQAEPQTAREPVPAATPPQPFTLARPVFDQTWATIGIGAAMVPSYAGSDDYIAFPCR